MTHLPAGEPIVIRPLSDLDQPLKPDKGKFNGSCNRRACQKPGANWYNSAMRAYYCLDCAHLINRAARDHGDNPLCAKHEVDGNGFTLWTGHYRKQHYDVRLANGEIVEHCWPNAGYMTAADGSGRQWTPEDNIFFRVSETHPSDRIDARRRAAAAATQKPVATIAGDEPATTTTPEPALEAPAGPVTRQQRRYMERQAQKRQNAGRQR